MLGELGVGGILRPAHYALAAMRELMVKASSRSIVREDLFILRK